ncbi:MAG: hypothetical protein KC535_00575 [Nanoarchaeota archaeon]|nr:hypothetical protein [Nanoarchaeota archaeon]
MMYEINKIDFASVDDFTRAVEKVILPNKGKTIEYIVSSTISASAGTVYLMDAVHWSFGIVGAITIGWNIYNEIKDYKKKVKRKENLIELGYLQRK